MIVTDATRGLRFPLETLHHLGVATEGGVQRLDRDAPIDAHVFALEDGAHAPFTNHPDDPVFVV